MNRVFKMNIKNYIIRQKLGGKKRPYLLKGVHRKLFQICSLLQSLGMHQSQGQADTAKGKFSGLISVWKNHRTLKGTVLMKEYSY